MPMIFNPLCVIFSPCWARKDTQLKYLAIAGERAASERPKHLNLFEVGRILGLAAAAVRLPRAQRIAQIGAAKQRRALEARDPAFGT